MAAAADLRDRMARHDAALWYVAQHERFAELEPVARATIPCCAGCMVYLALPAAAKRVPRMERGR